MTMKQEEPTNMDEIKELNQTGETEDVEVADAEAVISDKESKSEDNEYKEKYYYLAAEMQNIQKRFELSLIHI